MYVDNLYDGVRDGLVLLSVMDHVQPGVVEWSKVINEFQFARRCLFSQLQVKQVYDPKRSQSKLKPLLEAVDTISVG